MALTILLDMDGIVVDLVTPWLAAANAHCPPSARPLTVTDVIAAYSAIEEHACGKHVYDHLDGEMFRSLKPMPGALQGIETLMADGHDILIATASAKNPATAAAKLAWVEEHLKWTRHRVAIIQRKELLRGDVFIDDSPKNLRAYAHAWPRARLVTIAYPYNAGMDEPVARFQGWSEPAHAWGAMTSYVKCIAEEAP